MYALPEEEGKPLVTEMMIGERDWIGSALSQLLGAAGCGIDISTVKSILKSLTISSSTKINKPTRTIYTRCQEPSLRHPLTNQSSSRFKFHAKKLWQAARIPIATKPLHGPLIALDTSHRSMGQKSSAFIMLAGVVTHLSLAEHHYQDIRRRGEYC